VDLYVLAGASGQSLAFGPSHVSASAKPGAPDNIVLAGHRDTHFSFLRDLEAGDELILESPGRSHRYRVDGMEIVHESRTDLLLPSGRSELTLMTCFPFDSVVPGGPLRYVIFASRSR
jgi:sortase A